MKYDIFISYSRRDFDEVYELKKRIEEDIPNINFLFDIDGIESGSQFAEKIVSAINNCKYLLFVITKNSMRSEWTRKEVSYAQNKKKTIIPIIFDDKIEIDDYFTFQFGITDCITISDDLQYNKLLRDISRWTNKEIIKGNTDNKTIEKQTESEKTKQESKVKESEFITVHEDTYFDESAISETDEFLAEEESFFSKIISHRYFSYAWEAVLCIFVLALCLYLFKGKGKGGENDALITVSDSIESVENNDADTKTAPSVVSEFTPTTTEKKGEIKETYSNKETFKEKTKETNKEKDDVSSLKEQPQKESTANLQNETAQNQSTKTEFDSKDKVYNYTDISPTFNGNLNVWLSQNIKYPAVAAENGIEGRVIVQFIVEKDGSISNVTVVRGVDSSLDKEAARVVKSMPRWSPGTIKGEPVKCKFTLPIAFSLK